MNAIPMEDISTQGGEVQFDAEVAVGTARRYIDRHGSATIRNGHLTLRKSSGDVFVAAPLSEVWAMEAPRSRGGATRIFIGADAYMIERPWRFVRSRSWVTRRGVLNKRREVTQRFLAAVEAGGGHLGKPN